MNRFERECQVSPSMFRREREANWASDPLVRRQARARAIASFARAGRPCPVRPVYPDPAIIRQMDADVWRTLLLAMVIQWPADRPVPPLPHLSGEAAEDVAALFPSDRATYARGRDVGLTHERAMLVVDYRNGDITSEDVFATRGAPHVFVWLGDRVFPVVDGVVTA